MLDIAHELLRLRNASGLTRESLSNVSGTPIESIRAYEKGRRLPSATALRAISRGLGLSKVQTDGLLHLAGRSAEDSGGIFRKLQYFGQRLPSLVTELERCEWPAMVLNERHEIVGWNGLANSVAELDIGCDLTTPDDRNLLRMATTPHFDGRIGGRLRNWEELISRLVSVLKAEGARHPDVGFPPYLERLVGLIAGARPEVLHELLQMWASSPVWPDERRNVHPIDWQLSDGSRLSFLGAYRAWDHYSGTFVFDWHAADSVTTEWLSQRLSEVERRGFEGDPPRTTGFADAIFTLRTGLGMSRARLATLSGLSVDTVYSLERGLRRRPRRETVVKLCHGMSLDGFATNALLGDLGYEPEPSDWARWLAGQPPRGIFREKAPHDAPNLDALISEARALSWPLMLIDSKGDIAASSRAMDRIGVLPAIDGPGNHCTFRSMVMSEHWRRHISNWEEVAAALLPDLELETSSSSDVRVRQHTLERIFVPVRWQDENGTECEFHCLVNGWSVASQAWAMDWHPSNPGAWTAVAEAV